MREFLTSDREYHVSQTGDDTNAGTEASPLRTFNEALTRCHSLDFGGKKVQVKVGEGLWDEGFTVWGPMVGQLLQSDFTIEGDTNAPDRVVIDPTADPCLSIAHHARARFQGFKLKNANSSCVKAFRRAYLEIGHIEYGDCAFMHNQAANGKILAVADNIISGGATQHVVCEVGQGSFDFGAGVTYTLIGTPHFSKVFVDVGENSQVAAHTVNFVGNATGKKYTITNGGIIVTNYVNGDDLDKIPGDIPGTHVSRIRQFTQPVVIGERPAPINANQAQLLVQGDAEGGIEIEGSSASRILFARNGSVVGSHKYNHITRKVQLWIEHAIGGQWP